MKRVINRKIYPQRKIKFIMWKYKQKKKYNEYVKKRVTEKQTTSYKCNLCLQVSTGVYILR